MPQTTSEYIEKKIQYFEHKYRNSAPVIYQLLASFLLSLFAMFNKMLPRIKSPQVVYTRSLIMLIINSGLIHMSNLNCYDVKPDTRKKLIMRSIVGATAGMFYFQGMKFIPLSEAQVLFKTSPIWTSIIAVLILKIDKITKVQILTIAICTMGIVFVSRPPFILGFLYALNLIDAQEAQQEIELSNHAVGVILVLISSIFGSLVQILINAMSGEVNQLVILQYFSFISTIMPSFSQMLNQDFLFVLPDLYETILLLLLGISSHISQLFMNRSYLKGQLTVVSMVGQTTVLFGYMLDVVVLGTVINAASVVGTIMIMSSLLTLVLHKKKKRDSAVSTQSES